MVLADLGADVIKVERPGEGDDTRHWGPPFAGDDAAYFLSLNRNKRSVALDLEHARGRRPSSDGSPPRSDVLIENFRPGLMERFGLALEDLRREHPPLVTCSLTAFGDDAPETALASRLRHHRAGAVRADERHRRTRRRADESRRRAARRDHRPLCGGGGAGRAPRARRDGRGRHVSVSLFDASVAAMVNQASNYLIGGVVPERMGTAHPNIVPYQAFHASDRPFIVAGGQRPAVRQDVRGRRITRSGPRTSGSPRTRRAWCIGTS